MGHLERCLAEESAADYKAGLITFRELLRRLTTLTGSAVTALALAATLACTSSEPPAPATATIAPIATVASLTPATPFPTATIPPTAAPTVIPTILPTIVLTSVPTTALLPAGALVSPDDPSIQAGDVTFQNDGVTLMGYIARPKADGQYPAVLVIHENRGLLPHFPDVARRLAKEGYVALSLDLLSRQGGTSALNQAQVSAGLRVPQAQLIEDMNSAVRYLQRLPSVRADRIGAVGFCFGGGMVWLLCENNPDVKAAVPFYGTRPPLNDVPNMRAAVLGLYAANDNFINSSIPDLEAALKQNNKTYKFVTYPGAGHSFFNNTGQAYNAVAAEAAWRETLAWFGQ